VSATAFKLVLGDDFVSPIVGQNPYIDGSPLTYTVGTTVTDTTPGAPASDQVIAGIYLFTKESMATGRRDGCNVSRAIRGKPLLHVVEVEYDEADILWRGWPRSAPFEIAVSSVDVTAEV
jgi:hypothetical protein